MTQPKQTGALENEVKYLQIMKKLDPDMYMIRTMLLQTGVRPEVVVRYIRSLGNISMGTGYGIVRTTMQKSEVQQIRTEEIDKIKGVIL